MRTHPNRQDGANLPRLRARLFAVSTFGLFLFIALLLVNVRNPVNPVDNAIMQAFVNVRAGWLNPLVETFTQLFNTLPDAVYALAAIGIISWYRRDGWAALSIGLSMILAPLAMVAVKNVLDRSRPPLIDRLVEETSFSFPSGHATGIAALCCSIFLALMGVLSTRGVRRTGIILAVLAVLVASSRLYVGVHWGTDVLAGMALGLAVTCTVYGIFPQAMLAPRARSGKESPAQPQK